jgi:hypothetical protein
VLERRTQTRQLTIVEVDACRARGIRDRLHTRRTWNRDHVRPERELPGEYDLLGAHAELAANLLEDGIRVADCLRRLPDTPEWAPGQERDPKPTAVVQFDARGLEARRELVLHSRKSALTPSTWTAMSISSMLTLDRPIAWTLPSSLERVAFDIDVLLRLWTEPLPTDSQAAADKFRQVYTDPVSVNGTELTADDLVARARALQSTFESPERVVLDVADIGNKIAVAFRLRGRQIGPHTTALGVLQPTGRHIDLRVIDILTLTDGRMSSLWMVADELGALAAVDAVTFR